MTLRPAFNTKGQFILTAHVIIDIITYNCKSFVHKSTNFFEPAFLLLKELFQF